MSQIRKHSIKEITDVLASTDAASKSYVDNATKVISSSSLDFGDVFISSSAVCHIQTGLTIASA